MEYESCFRRELQRRYGAGHEAMWAEIEERHRALAADVAFARRSSNPMDRRLDFCACFLATIQCLEKRGEDFATIRAVCLAITMDYVTPKTGLQRFLRALPAKLIGTPLRGVATSFMKRKTGHLGHPDGFLVQVITSASETNGLKFGFDILECGVCKLFVKHGAVKYVSILCEVDEMTSSMVGLELVRGGTIAGGRAKCDFRFRRLSPRR